MKDASQMFNELPDGSEFSGDVSGKSRTAGWVMCADSLPELGDYSVLCYFAETDAVEMVHVEDYFRDITAGIGEDGEQLWTKWYLSVGITHWHEMPRPPNRSING